ncbi:MAG: ABC transporter ATP-binding protein [Chloroflexi bacterium]|nr:ABC transporter ATP-binding protein [Chloroflexota bacterium]
MIRAAGLVKSFGSFRAVDGFSFEVEPGEIYGLLGPNGAGKTTTTRMLSCLLRPSSGTAWVAGHSIDTAAHLIRGKIGILTEVPGLYTRLTPIEYLDFFATVQSVARGTRAARIEQVLKLVGMWGQRRAVMHAFSKGMQQRVAIARALLHEPEVLFFDEPTAALDPEAAKRVRDHLIELAEERRRTVLLCTHNLTEAEQLCRRLSIVQGGKQIAEGTPAQLRAGMRRTMRLRLGMATADLAQRLRAIPGVSDLDAQLAGGLLISYGTATPERTNPEVVRAAVAAGADVVGLEEQVVSMEEVYLAVLQNQRSIDGHVSLEHAAAPVNGRIARTRP